MKQLGMFTIIAFALLMVVLSCDNAGKSPVVLDYEDYVIKERLSKDSTFRYPQAGERSPIPEGERTGFNGLNYFPVDEGYNITAKLIRTVNEPEFEMKTSTERLPVYRKFGDIVFHFPDNKFSLEVYQNVDLITKEGFEDYLFLPFTDETSGDESYGGGRYIDLKIPTGDTIMVDFNMSYNPYCNYSDKFSCPVPPPQNHISVRIEAGEKNYH